jgi:aspartate kinase
MIKVFKFGGASVKDSAAVRNMCDIVRSFCNDSLVVVVSAMGKTTNAIERIHAARFRGEPYQEELEELTRYHEQMVEELFGDDTTGSDALRAQLEAFKRVLNNTGSGNFDQDYDSLIGFGELISTAIVQAYLSYQEISSLWIDARDIIITDSRYRDARVNWEVSACRILPIERALSEKKVCVIQGFIGSTTDGHSTSLGREGSDFTASIMAYLLNASDVTIWKDVPGMLNADPKKFQDTVKLDRISFKEAIELAYYGASVIHPKTIKPLQNKGIPLHIKSFVDPAAAGSIIEESTENDHLIPCFILKENQVLLSVSTRDFSFIVEDNLKEIFDVLSVIGIRVHLMENSAISFSIVFDQDDYKMSELLKQLGPHYMTRYNTQLQLMTVRHGNESIVAQVSAGKELLLEQRSRQTTRLLMRM